MVIGQYYLARTYINFILMLTNHDRQIRKEKVWRDIQEKSDRMKYGRVEVIIKEGQIERFEITNQFKPKFEEGSMPELETKQLGD